MPITAQKKKSTTNIIVPISLTSRRIQEIQIHSPFYRGITKDGENDVVTNSIVKVTIKTGIDLLSTNKTEDGLSFTKVYGFKTLANAENLSQHHNLNYIEHFVVATENNESFFVVNNFRGRGFGIDQRYTLTAGSSGTANAPWASEVSSDKLMLNSYYGIVMGSENNILTTSFFENKLKLFQLTNKQLTELKTIE